MIWAASSLFTPLADAPWMAEMVNKNLQFLQGRVGLKVHHDERGLVLVRISGGSSEPPV